MSKNVADISLGRLRAELDSSVRRFGAADYSGLILFACDPSCETSRYHIMVEYTDEMGTESAYIETDLEGYMDVMQYKDAAAWVIEQAGYNPGEIITETRFLRAGANLL